MSNVSNICTAEFPDWEANVSMCGEALTMCGEQLAAALEPPPSECEASAADAFGVPLHVGGIFIILAASLLGALMPLLGKLSPRCALPPFAIAIGKAAGTGIILACALVHMLLPANAALTDACLSAAFTEDYVAYAYLFCMIGAIIMHNVEVLLAGVLGDAAEEAAGAGGGGGGAGAKSLADDAAPPGIKAPPAAAPAHSEECRGEGVGPAAPAGALSSAHGPRAGVDAHRIPSPLARIDTELPRRAE
jgi:hypothetical protein